MLCSAVFFWKDFPESILGKNVRINGENLVEYSKIRERNLFSKRVKLYKMSENSFVNAEY